MTIAGNITLVTVTGEYVDYRGDPVAGQVTFTLPKTLRNELADQIMVPSSFAATLNAFGQFSIVLPASDDPQFNESFVYTITEAFAGGRTWQAALPEATTTVKMTSLVPAYTGEAFSELASYQAYVLEEGVVTEEEAKISYSPAGIKVPVDYGGLMLAYLTYSALASGPATYAAVTAGPFIVQYAGIVPYEAEAVALAAEAEGWADQAIEQAEELFPHPFVFTGSLGVRR